RAEQKKKLEDLLDEFHLHHVRKNNGDSLSGGERRRTEIARALAVDPKFILLDEPFAGVDPIAVEDIQTVVARLKFRNIGILITDHNVNETLSICDRAYLLIDGKIFKHGTAEELAEDEQVRRLYLGRNFELKRKDYLHEEARQKMESYPSAPPEPAAREIKPEKLAQSIEYLITETDKVFNSAADGNSIDQMNVDFADYTRFFTEIKNHLLSYGESQQQPKLIEAARQLRILDARDYASGGALGGMNPLGAVLKNISKLSRLEKLKTDLLDNKGLLQKLLLYVKNPEFLEVM
ncbi:MAG TPA: ATP-binding cassette domain-containing protein, partial [Puia sp.]